MVKLSWEKSPKEPNKLGILSRKLTFIMWQVMWMYQKTIDSKVKCWNIAFWNGIFRQKFFNKNVLRKWTICVWIIRLMSKENQEKIKEKRRKNEKQKEKQEKNTTRKMKRSEKKKIPKQETIAAFKVIRTDGLHNKDALCLLKQMAVHRKVFIVRESFIRHKNSAKFIR